MLEHASVSSVQVSQQQAASNNGSIPGALMPRGLREHIKQSKAFKAKSHEAMLSLIVAAVQVRERIERVCRNYGLTFTHYNILRILRGAPEGGFPRCDIIDRMLDPGPDVTRLINHLVKNGWVQRVRCEEDARRHMHWITDEGRALLGEMEEEIDAVHQHFGRRFAERELDHLIRICSGIYRDDDGDAQVLKARIALVK